MHTESTSQPIMNYLTLVILFIYAVLLFTGITYHEMWMDESHHWLVARESDSLADLIHNYRYDGHPVLWILIMYCYSWFSETSVGMQYLHGVISLVCTAMVLFKAPFARTFAFAWVLSYFSLYEYGVLSRNYSLLMLFSFSLPIAWKTRRKHPWLPWLILGFISNTHLFGLIFSVAFVIVCIVRRLVNNQRSDSHSIYGYSIYILLLGLSIYFIIPPNDHPSASVASLDIAFDSVADTLMLFFKALVPIPDVTSQFSWNTNLLTTTLKMWVAPLAISSWLLPLLFQWRHRWLVWVWYLSALLITGFFLVTTLNSGVRYGGILIIILLVLKWIDSLEVNIPNPKHQLSKNRTLLQVVIISILMTVQVCSAGYHIYQDINSPFSTTKDISQFIEREELDHIPVLSNAFCNCISYNNYTDRPIYFLNVASSMSFCKWELLGKAKGKNSQYDLSQSIEESINYLEQQNLEQVVLLYHGNEIFTQEFIKLSTQTHARAQYLQTFNKGLVKRENYAVYLIQ